MHNIVHLFTESAAKYREKTAIVDKTGSITYGELHDAVRKTAASFHSAGIGRGDRVLVFVPMSRDLYRIVLALFYVGAVPVFLDAWVSKKRMEDCCRIADCKGFIGIWKAKVLALFSKELRKIPVRLSMSRYKSYGTSLQPVEVAADDTALITFTTGSTDLPKAARRTHGFLYEQFKATAREIDPAPGDVDMPALPIVLLINLGAGCTSLIADFRAGKPDSLRPEKIARQLQAHKANRLIASPFFVTKLAEYVLKNNITLGLEKIFTGGAPVFPREAQLYVKAFPAAEVFIVFGSTEAEPISSVSAHKLLQMQEHLQKGLYVGLPDKHIKVKIIKYAEREISGNELPSMLTAAGEAGEIIVAGAHVLKEYFNSPQARKRNKIDYEGEIWHRTGDSGFLSEDGGLFLLGRCRQLMVRNGKLYAPFLLENILCNIPGVVSGTYISVKDKMLCVVELEANVALKEVALAIQKEAPEYDEIKAVKKIPRDPRHNSKIDYQKLTEMLGRDILKQYSRT